MTTIPTELAAAVADACPELMEAEAVVLNYLKAGRPDPKGFAAARAESHRRIEALAGRLRRGGWPHAPREDPAGGPSGLRVHSRGESLILTRGVRPTF